MSRISGKTDSDRRLRRLGEEIRARRKYVGLSQEALAVDAGIDRSHMGKIERGERNVSLLNVIKIAVALRCKASEILADAGL